VRDVQRACGAGWMGKLAPNSRAEMRQIATRSWPRSAASSRTRRGCPAPAPCGLPPSRPARRPDGGVTGAGRDRADGFIRGQPRAGGKVARAGAMTAGRARSRAASASTPERGGVARFERSTPTTPPLRHALHIGVGRHTRDSILATFERRLANALQPSAPRRWRRSATSRACAWSRRCRGRHAKTEGRLSPTCWIPFR